ncbi:MULTISPECIES: tyrosine-type recombinase/integrase [Protofrankia]|uniref:tyrosine-type recombinase/integrase n=1 Tax=Protofrankia TaxID=2994361 RepID=UPI0009787E60|nr:MULTISPECIES: tyrosine-type recombinase/integrase [Protofrankia]ONH35675.1 hypothetical protein BL254_10300 [Protofrankia sp. BMG5.30]
MVIFILVVTIIEGVDPVWPLLLDAWDQSLATAGRSHETRTAYRKAGVALVNWLAGLPEPPAGWTTPRTGTERRAARRAAADAGEDAVPLYRPAEPPDITRAHVERFLIAFGSERTARCPNGRSKSTINQTFRSLQQFFSWLIDEDEIESSPMERMERPAVGETVAPLLDLDELRALVAACRGKDFRSRRDEAIIRVFADSGGRLSEIADLTVDDVDMTRSRLLVTGKGNRQRYISVGKETMLAINRYLRLRIKHKKSAIPALWLAHRGDAMTPSGVYQMVRRRGQEAGIKLRPHLFRHTLADAWLTAGGGELTLADHMGWAGTQMVRRYGAAGRARRAQQEHERLALGERLSTPVPRRRRTGPARPAGSPTSR